MTRRVQWRVVGGLLPVTGLALLLASAAAPSVCAAEEASVKGHVSVAGERIELTGVAAFQRGPRLVVLLTDKPIPAGSVEEYAGKWLEDTGLKGVEMGLKVPEPGASGEGSAPQYVRYLAGDGTGAYDSGPHPQYQFEAETLDAKHVAGRLHGMIVYFPKEVEIDVTFSVPVQ